MRDLTVRPLEQLQSQTADAVFEMDEEGFRQLYDRTAKPLWAYLWRVTGDRHRADDLLQETYYRFLRARAITRDDAHQRNYLFRIATNLILDARRRTPSPVVSTVDIETCDAGDGNLAAHRTARRLDLTLAMSRLRPRERAMLWLAYGQGASHEQIAHSLGVKTSSMKLLLFRARRKLAALLAGSERRGGRS
jgi:RNA polymerase sigma-70 factor, ECF subfamily